MAPEGAIVSTKFVRNKSTRFVGFEMEGYAPNDLVDRQRIGEVSDDGSIRPPRGQYSFEFKSRPANGDSLLDVINKTYQMFRDQDVGVNRSCGFHVHLDMTDSTKTEQTNVKKWWIAYQDIFYSLVKPDRRGSYWCQPMRSVGSFGEKDPKASSMNTDAMHYLGTFEVRLHHATTKKSSMEGWIILLVNFFDTFSLIDATPERLAYVKGLTPKKKLTFFMLQMKLPRGLRTHIRNKIKEYGRVTDINQIRPEREDDDNYNDDDGEPCNCEHCREARGED